MSIHAAIDDVWARQIIMEGLQEASEVSGRTVQELISPKLDKLTAQARQAAMWYAHKKGVSNPVIGSFFKKDHTTVIHAVKAAEKRIAKNSVLEVVPVFKSARGK